MNNCLGCAGVPPDDGFSSFIMGMMDNPLGIPLIILLTLILLILLDQFIRFFIDAFKFFATKNGGSNE